MKASLSQKHGSESISLGDVVSLKIEEVDKTFFQTVQFSKVRQMLDSDGKRIEDWAAVFRVIKTDAITCTVPKS